MKRPEQGADGSGLDVSLTPEERKKVNAIKESLDLTDSQACIQYGTGAQRNISDFSNRFSLRFAIRTAVMWESF